MPRRRSAACQSGCSRHGEMALSDSPNSSAERIPSCTVHDRISPVVTDTTTSIASSRPFGTSNASTARSTCWSIGRPSSKAASVALSGSCRRRCTNTMSGSKRASPWTIAAARRISSAVTMSSGWGAPRAASGAVSVVVVMGSPSCLPRLSFALVFRARLPRYRSRPCSNSSIGSCIRTIPRYPPPRGMLLCTE